MLKTSRTAHHHAQQHAVTCKVAWCYSLNGMQVLLVRLVGAARLHQQLLRLAELHPALATASQAVRPYFNFLKTAWRQACSGQLPFLMLCALAGATLWGTRISLGKKFPQKIKKCISNRFCKGAQLQCMALTAFQCKAMLTFRPEPSLGAACEVYKPHLARICEQNICQ